MLLKQKEFNISIWSIMNVVSKKEYETTAELQ